MTILLVTNNHMLLALNN